MREKMKIGEQLDVARGHGYALEELLKLFPARGVIKHWRPKDWVKNLRTGLLEPDYCWRQDGPGPVVDPDSAELVDECETRNLITKAGIDFMILQSYGSAGLGANGLNYIGLSVDALTEDANSTTLTTEIASGGLSRAQGTYAHTAGTGVVTIQKTFTSSGTHTDVQKAALFSAGAAGSMNHVLAFTAQDLVSGNLLQVTFTITLAAA